MNCQAPDLMTRQTVRSDVGAAAPGASTERDHLLLAAASLVVEVGRTTIYGLGVIVAEPL